MPSGNTHNGVWNAGIVQGDKGLSRIPHFDVVKSNPTPKQGSSSHSQNMSGANDKRAKVVVPMAQGKFEQNGRMVQAGNTTKEYWKNKR